MTQHTDELNAEIGRIDRLHASADAQDFAEKVLIEPVEFSHARTFDVDLVEDPEVSMETEPWMRVTASLDLEGDIDSVVIFRLRHGREAESVSVEPDSGLWKAVEVWWHDFRTTWSGD